MSPTNTRAVAKVDPQLTLKAELDRVRGAMAEVLPKHVTPERIIKVVLSATARNRSLLECSIPSIVRAVMQSAELGLEIGGLLGEAYLVPFKRSWKEGGQWRQVQEAQCIVGYRGLLKLARQSGQIQSVVAHVVHENDEYMVNLAADEILHRPTLRGEPGAPLFAYAIARFKDGSRQLDVMTRAEIELVRARSKAKDTGPWVTDWAEMARKTVVRRLCKYLPLSPELARAMELDIEAEDDAPVATVHAIEGKPSRGRSLAEGILARAAAIDAPPDEPPPSVPSPEEQDEPPPEDAP